MIERGKDNDPTLGDGADKLKDVLVFRTSRGKEIHLRSHQKLVVGIASF